jgi:hypothetical protein
MTSYAPPTIDYFSGLQFNPNIYENTLVTGVSKVFGVLVTIIGTISAIITAPIIQLIASTKVDIFTPQFQHRLSSSGAIQLFISSTLSSLQNATQTTIFSPDTRINASGSSAVATTIGNGVVGGTLLLNAESSDIRSRYVEFKPASAGLGQVDLNFKTSSANPTIVSSAISASGGTSTAFAGQMDINVRTMNNNAVIHNILSSTLTMSQAGGSTIVNGDLFGGGGSQGNTLFWSGDAYTQIAVPTSPATYDLSPASIPRFAVYSPPYLNATAFTIVLANLNNRDGCYFYIYNGGNATITVQHSTTGQAKLFGPGLTRGGTNSLTIGVNAGRGFRNSIFPNGTLNGGFNNGYFTWVL